MLKTLEDRGAGGKGQIKQAGYQAKVDGRMLRPVRPLLGGDARQNVVVRETKVAQLEGRA